MTHLENQLSSLRKSIIEMWQLVHSQFTKSLSALETCDKDLAREVITIEKRVNSFELSIDSDCEDIFALQSPVANDLRFVLAVLKINTNLERIGDIAEGIAKYVISASCTFKQPLLDATKVVQMYNECIGMLEDSLNGFEKEDTSFVRGIFKKDEFLDEINNKANELIIAYLKNNPDDIDQALYILSIIRRLERVGDQVKNIGEEIIFYVEAKVIKHNKVLRNS